MLKTQIPIFARRASHSLQENGTFFLNMFVKLLALCLIMGICLGIPVEDTKPAVPKPPVSANELPVKPPNADHSDLKTDPSTWWYTSWYNTQPVYYYNYYHPRPTYTVWHPYYY